eukprot:scaffold12050_cov168-Amphora_coffeaeformis.AAC.1
MEKSTKVRADLFFATTAAFSISFFIIALFDEPCSTPTRILPPAAMETLKESQLSPASTKDQEPKPSTFDNDDDGEYDLEDDEDEYPHLFQSIRSPTGLEVGVSVTWPGTEPIELSTCLPSDEIAPMFHGTQWYVTLVLSCMFFAEQFDMETKLTNLIIFDRHRAGTRVWKAAIVALQYLLDEKGPLKERLERTGSSSFSCLELGCGLGVPGMILSRFHPEARVVLTDCDSLLTQLQHNLAQNFANASSTLTAATLDWAEENDLTRLLQECQLNSFDLVLNCDCIYEPLYGDSWKAL